MTFPPSSLEFETLLVQRVILERRIIQLHQELGMTFDEADLIQPNIDYKMYYLDRQNEGFPLFAPIGILVGRTGVHSCNSDVDINSS